MSVNFNCVACGDPVHAAGINEPPPHGKCLICWVMSLTDDERSLERLRALHLRVRALKRVGGGIDNHWTSGQELY